MGVGGGGNAVGGGGCGWVERGRKQNARDEGGRQGRSETTRPSPLTRASRDALFLTRACWKHCRESDHGRSRGP